ncbi:MAG: hypothetical protein ACRDPA_31575, partial [Solirubrobacteraceae bacterium]
MPERDRSILVNEHPGAQAGFQLREVLASDGLEQPQLGSRRYHCRRLEQPAGRRRELRGPREHRVADGGGYVHPGRRERLGDEERIAARLLEQLLHIHRGGLGQRPHGVERERRDVTALGGARAGELAEDDLQRADRRQLVVAEGHERQRREVLDPSP